MPVNKENMLEVSVVARRLDVSPSTVYRLMDQGKLQRIRVGVTKGYRIPESSFLAYQQAMLAALEVEL